MDSTLKELQTMTKQCDGVIAHEPFGDEIRWDNTSFPLALNANIFIIPNKQETDPFTCAAECTTKFKGKTPCILVPGRIFDIHGTRHGRGGGWYDRFLSAVPKTWIRIGITITSRLSENNLVRNSWDEPVDWLLVFNGDGWRSIKTEARNKH